MTDTLITEIVSWSEKANKGFTEEKLKSLYKNLISEEFYEVMSADSDANEYNELMDLLWVTIVYCSLKGYDVSLGLTSLVKANQRKLIDPEYDSSGKLLKGRHYVKPDWNQVLELSRRRE